MASVAPHDPEQLRLMSEECILVDKNDCITGHATKKECHIHDGESVLRPCKLHRAFSVFLFNTQRQLLVQQRAKTKITFPLRWTNTCCSHPLYEIEKEREEHMALGVKRAAIRKLEHELGITGIEEDDLKWLTKIHYGANSDGIWGEHEIDWILFVQKDVEIRPNSNEVQAVQYVTAQELQQLIDEHKRTGTVLTPWFDLIAQELIFPWWKKLDTIIADGSLGEEQRTIIHRLGDVAKRYCAEN